MNDIRILREDEYGLSFVPPEFLGPGEDEYRIRDVQLRALGRDPASYRRLKPYEIEALVKNENTCADWNLFRVTDPFTPELVKSNEFAGLIRLGRLERVVLEHHDLQTPAGITNSRMVSCDVGDNCAIHDSSYLAHYIIGDGCVLLNNDEIQVSNHAKYGNGIVMEGEPEDVRIVLDLMNEAGGRSVLPFEGMCCADAYLWAKRREDGALMAAFEAMTDAAFDHRRGRYGTIGRWSVLKSNGILKDVAVGECAYIKGANKLKNLTILSSEAERTQIGEGVEMVNGIVGRGCRVFYGCKAVRFVMGSNSALKYGARLIHSVLGANSTVSCCEMLNNLIFPAHEQHHNTSFLVASLVKGQSNMAAGATVGSNHNSRANDGEIEAGRGFWPGLCTSLKHSSRFASYCLLSKSDFRHELDVRLPFCLVDDDRSRDRLVLVPAFWWTHNLYALMRNEAKFRSRDRRAAKVLSIEFSPFAPDTADEIVAAIGLLESWAGPGGLGPAEAGAVGEGPVGAGADPDIAASGVERSERPTAVLRPRRARAAYREMLLWYAGRAVLDRAEQALARGAGLAGALAELDAPSEPRSSAVPGWENLGGQLAPAWRVEETLERVRSGSIATWEALHAEYARLAGLYPLDRDRHAWGCLGYLYGAAAGTGSSAATAGTGGAGAGAGRLERALRDLADLSRRVEEGVYRSRRKDYDNPFRRSTYRSDAEMVAVVGRPEENSFVVSTRRDMAALRERIGRVLAGA